MTAELTVRLVGGPTAVIELGGVRLLTDPTFDPPGDHPIGDRVLTKTSGPALPAEDLGRVDAVLLSHDQHPDNLDRLADRRHRSRGGRCRAAVRGSARTPSRR
jgi:L-ascorbate metabolism protein UlaG (beta-lactamase superfamily)